MSFRFVVDKAGQLPSSGIYYVEGRLESGNLLPGIAGFVENDPPKRIVIKSIAIACVDPERSKVITLSIEDPCFPVDQLVGLRLVGD